MSCGPEKDDFWIDDDLKCTGCGYQFDIEGMSPLFVVEESGIAPGTVHGPDVHWAWGYIVCPQCGVQLPYETSS